MNAKTLILTAGILGAAGVALGAFGAHSLPDILSSFQLSEEDLAKRQQNFEVAVRYQIYHTLGLFGVGLLAVHVKSRAIAIAGISFLLGIFIFCGFLYGIVFTGISILGAIVPIGGVSFIVGWIALAAAATKLQQSR